MATIRENAKGKIAEKKRKKQARMSALVAEAEKKLAKKQPSLIAKIMSNREKAKVEKARREEKRKKERLDKEKKLFEERKKERLEQEQKRKSKQLEREKKQLELEERAKRRAEAKRPPTEEELESLRQWRCRMDQKWGTGKQKLT